MSESQSTNDYATSPVGSTVIIPSLFYKIQNKPIPQKYLNTAVCQKLHAILCQTSPFHTQHHCRTHTHTHTHTHTFNGPFSDNITVELQKYFQKCNRTYKFSSHRVFPTNSHMEVVHRFPVLFYSHNNKR